MDPGTVPAANCAYVGLIMASSQGLGVQYTVMYYNFSMMDIFVQGHLEQQELWTMDTQKNHLIIVYRSSKAIQLNLPKRIPRLSIRSSSLKLPREYRLPLIVQMLRTMDELQATRLNPGIPQHPNRSGPSSATHDQDCSCCLEIVSK